MSRRNISIALGFTLLAAAAGDALPDINSMAVPRLASLPLTATPLPLDRDDPGVTRVGALRFMGAVQLRSTAALFGGLSGLRAGPGTRLLAESDTGNWVAFDTVEQGGRLVGVANAFIAPILRPDGHPAINKADGDAEAVEWNPATGDATISYEQDHRLVHFTGIDADRPATLTHRRSPSNVSKARRTGVRTVAARRWRCCPAVPASSFARIRRTAIGTRRSSPSAPPPIAPKSPPPTA